MYMQFGRVYPVLTFTVWTSLHVLIMVETSTEIDKKILLEMSEQLHVYVYMPKLSSDQ